MVGGVTLLVGGALYFALRGGAKKG